VIPDLHPAGLAADPGSFVRFQMVGDKADDTLAAAKISSTVTKHLRQGQQILPAFDDDATIPDEPGSRLIKLTFDGGGVVEPQGWS
jgi:hypothetical protein